jgi:hypothetical protein
MAGEDHNDRTPGPGGLDAQQATSQLLMLSLQMQAIALSIEDLRGRLAHIERQLAHYPNDERSRVEPGKLERIW